MSMLRRLVCCGSVLNVVIVCVVFLWPNSCDDTDCAAGTTLQHGGGKGVCYVNAREEQTPEADDVGKRRYNCPIPRFSDVPMKATALASRPGSGNTWVRHLVQEATGK